MGLLKIGCDNVDWIQPALIQSMASFCEHPNTYSGSTKGVKRDHVIKYQLPKKDFAQWGYHQC